MEPHIAEFLANESQQTMLALSLAAITFASLQCCKMLRRLDGLYESKSKVSPQDQHALRQHFLELVHLKLTPRQVSQLSQKSLLTPNELEFYNRLTRALPSHVVLAQVSMGALIDVTCALPDQSYEIREAFARKIVDYVICDAGLKVVALVELDDRTHDPLRDEARDQLTRAAGYRTLRWDSRQKPDVESIRTAVSSL